MAIEVIPVPLLVEVPTTLFGFYSFARVGKLIDIIPLGSKVFEPRG
jgi:hypothetical protein